MDKTIKIASSQKDFLDKIQSRLDEGKIVFLAALFAEEKKALDTEILDIRDCADIFDYIMITSGDSPAQLKAIARNIEEKLSLQGLEPSHKEGKYGDIWFLLDYGDFVVHVIDSNAREFYNLEELWSRAYFVPEHQWFERIEVSSNKPEKLGH